MPHDRDDWQRRIKAVELEHSTIRLATDRLLDQFDRDPGAVGKALKRPDILIASKNLDGTYVIRLFAEFETGLRSCWDSVRSNPPPSRTRDLVDGIASTFQIPHDVRVRAHHVREYRNSLIHERERDVDPIPIARSRSHLCTFFAKLPPSW